MAHDKFRIDSHKLIYHPDRVSAWAAGKTIYPIYMEISPAGACNHRCLYCGLDFMEYQNRFLDTTVLKERLTELGRLGLKSIMYAGEGEPFLHKDFVDILVHTKQAGIDAAITTNAVLFKPALAEMILPHTEWIKVSINGATAETYARIHRTRPDDFDKVMANLHHAVQVRHDKGYRCALGMQLLLLPENHQEAVALAKLARDLGMDYLVIKPYSQHPQSKTIRYRDIKYHDYLHIAKELEEINTATFSVIFRLSSMVKWDESLRTYSRCLALPFWSYIDAGGNVWGCSVYLGDERFLYGNIYQNTFEEIWVGPKRKESLKFVAEHFDASSCRVNCRMDEVNRYLWELKNPPAHVHFYLMIAKSRTGTT